VEGAAVVTEIDLTEAAKAVPWPIPTGSGAESLVRYIIRHAAPVIRRQVLASLADEYPNGTYATINVIDGASREWPVVERVSGGWQSGFTHYPDEKVRAVRVLNLTAERDALRAAVARVEALHQPKTGEPFSLVSTTYCSCGAHPCPTRAALAGAPAELREASDE
jgi:hypothetical protein